MQIAEYIARAKQQLERAEKLERLLKKYPDLHVETNSHGENERLLSKYVNPAATLVYIGCEGGFDSERTVVWASTVDDGETIYSDPCRICVGNDERYDDWEEILRSYNMSQVVIDKVDEYFKQYETE